MNKTEHRQVPANELAHQVLSDQAMDQALDWLIRLEGLDATERVAFDTWLAADPAHAQAFARAQAVWHGASVGQAAQMLQAPQRPARWRPRCKPLASAAVLLLGLFSVSDLPLHLKADHVTAVGERQRLQLADGAKVLLNTHSAFSSQQNSAQLYRGEAWFDVPSTQTPLELEAGPVHASVRDTAFAVRYLNGTAQVLVQRGNVDLRANRNEHVRLNAGDSIRVGPTGFGQRERVHPERDLGWVQGRLIFENTPLHDVLAELARYYPGWIVNTNERLANVAVTGNYRLDNPLDVVRSLAHVTSARIHELPTLVILN